MLKPLLLSTLLFTAVLGQNTSDPADETNLLDDDIEQNDEVDLQDEDDELQDEVGPSELVLSDELGDWPEISGESDILSRSMRNKNAEKQTEESKARKRSNNDRGRGGRSKTAGSKKHREPQKGPLITREDICYRLKLNVLRDFERYIDLYSDKCRINSI